MDASPNLVAFRRAEVTLDTLELFAGAFVGLVGARINGGD